MFSISTQSYGSLSSIKLLNETTQESAMIIPGFGATLNSLILKKDNLQLEVIDGNPNEAYLKSEGIGSYKGMVLFPYPNRIKGGLYTFEGRMYKFEINDGNSWNNSLHGFFAKAAFELTVQEANKSRAMVEMVCKTDGDHSAYPFAVELKVQYMLSKNGLEVKAIATNIGKKTAPVGLGWHPYFKLNAKLNDLEMWLPPHYELQTDKELIPTGRKNEGYTFTSFEPVGDIFLDNGYQLATQEPEKIVRLHDTKQNVILEITCGIGCEYLQIYTPPHRNSIAIEPQSCAPDAFNNKLGLWILESSKSKTLSYSVAIK